MESKRFKNDVEKFLNSDHFLDKIRDDTFQKIERMMGHIKIYLNINQDKVFEYLKNPKGANFPWSFDMVMKTK